MCARCARPPSLCLPQPSLCSPCSAAGNRSPWQGVPKPSPAKERGGGARNGKGGQEGNNVKRVLGGRESQTVWEGVWKAGMQRKKGRKEGHMLFLGKEWGWRENFGAPGRVAGEVLVQGLRGAHASPHTHCRVGVGGE